jgi:hypothetical protein
VTTPAERDGTQFAQHVSAVSPLAGALDGTPAKRKRAAKRANPNSEVTRNVVCYCRERFDDLVDYSTHVRGGCPELVRVGDLRKANGIRLIAECGTRSGYNRHRDRGEEVCEPCREAIRKESRKRRETTPGYCEAARERERRRRATPEYREHDRKRRATPEYREAQREARRKYRATPNGREVKREQDRKYRTTPEGRETRREGWRKWLENPENREAKREHDRRYRARKKAEKDAALKAETETRSVE